MGLLALVPAEVRAAYELMTQDFAPLDMAARLEPLLGQIGQIASPMSAASPVKDLAMADYVPALRNAAVVRMAKQLSEVYSTMRIEELAKVRDKREREREGLCVNRGKVSAMAALCCVHHPQPPNTPLTQTQCTTLSPSTTNNSSSPA